MEVTNINDIQVGGKKVLVRADLDLGEEIVEEDKSKLETLLPTIKYLQEKNSRVILIGHRGRPKGEVKEELSLKPVAEMLSKVVGSEVKFVGGILGEVVNSTVSQLGDGELLMLENLRFDSREKANDEEFAKQLASLGEVYVNEAFSVSHREHASIVGVPKFLPHAAGIHLVDEIDNLNKILVNPKKPVVFIISGLKKDKLEFLEEFVKTADRILIAGRLPELLDNYLENHDVIVPSERLKKLQSGGKVVVAHLIQDKEDITLHSVEKFEGIVASAGTIMVSGPVGKFEDEGHRQGTQRVFKAVAQTNAFKVAGGGDTEQALDLLGLRDKFDWVSVGGGASLQFLAKGTLPGIEVLKSE